MKYVLRFLTIALFFVSQSAFCQKMTVESFTVAANDLSASVYSRNDLNGRRCALVKVGLAIDGAKFEGGVMGDVENKTGEYWVYMPQGNRMLQIKHKNFLPLMVTFEDYGIEKLASNTTYKLTILLPERTNSFNEIPAEYSTLTYLSIDRELMLQACNGDGRAQAQIGDYFRKGEKGVQRDSTEALKWYQKSASQGNPFGQYGLGVCYQKGIAVKKDESQSKNFYQMAFAGFKKLAEKSEDAEAMYRVGDMYDDGEGTSQDYAQAMQWYQKAAQLNNSDAITSIGYMFNKAHGVKQDYVEAVKWYRKAAEMGNAIAQFNLGVSYKYGEGVKKDYTEAMRWYRLSAEQGNSNAENAIGVMYDHGYGVKQDYAEALKWFRKAADKENEAAQRNIGYMYSNGRGVEVDEAEAIKWYRKAAEQGYAPAQLNLGVILYNNADYEENPDSSYIEAMKWFRKAADQGNEIAIYNIGLLYEYGNGVPRDSIEALKCYRKSADLGYVDAMKRIGCLYYYGNGVKKDQSEAYRWYRKAVEKSNEEADKKMSSKQIELETMCVLGEDIAEDYRDDSREEAAKWYEKAAAKGHARAIFRLGSTKLWSDKTEQEQQEGIQIVRKAADMGCVEALLELGDCYLVGMYKIKEDRAEALKYYKKAADLGSKDGKERYEDPEGYKNSHFTCSYSVSEGVSE